MDDNGASNPDDRLSAIGRALSCSVRLAVLQTLAEGDASVGELVACTGVSQPNMSNHLAVLRFAEMVISRRHGRIVRYELASPAVAALVNSLTVLANTEPRLPSKTDSPAAKD
jgi:DNA-binding transcriptional ArsR family regulator